MADLEDEHGIMQGHLRSIRGHCAGQQHWVSVVGTRLKARMEGDMGKQESGEQLGHSVQHAGDPRRSLAAAHAARPQPHPAGTILAEICICPK